MHSAHAEPFSRGVNTVDTEVRPASRAWEPVRPSVSLAVLGATLVLTAVAAFADVFSFFAFWDDEGYFLLTARHFLDGCPLYDEVFTVYGPFYYLYKWTLHGLVGLPLTSDVIRANTVVVWVATAGLCFATLFRLTGSLPLAVLGQLGIFFHLRFFRNEPGHAHELGTLVVALLPLAAAVFGERRRAIAAALLGALAGVAITLKLNVGVFAAAGAWTALLATTRPVAPATTLSLATAAAALALPWVVMRPQLHEAWCATYAAATAAAVGTSVLLALFRGERRGPLKDLALFAGCFMLVASGACFFVVARGTSWQGLFECLVLAPARLSSTFSIPLPLEPRMLAFSALSVVAALALAPEYPLYREPRAAGVRGAILAGAKFLFALAVGGFVVSRRVDELFGYVVPFVWVVLVPARATRAAGSGPGAGGSPAQAAGAERLPLARLVLVLTAAFQTLQAYPVAGSQRAFGTFLLIAIAGVAAADVLDSLRAYASSHRLVSAVGLWRALPATVVGIALLTAVGGTAERWAHRQAQVPLRLPGSRLLRVDPIQAGLYHDLLAALKGKDAFFALTGSNSIYFWTGTRPPTRLVLSHELRLFPESMLRKLVDSTLAHENPCIIAGGPSLGDQPYLPSFHGYIDQHFVAATRVGPYTLMVPKRGADVLPAATSGQGQRTGGEVCRAAGG